jgi:hypothetical protein
MLFVPSPNAQAAQGEGRDKHVLRPWAGTKHVPMPILELLRFLGRLMGAALRTGAMLNLDLPGYFWSQMVGMNSTLGQLRQIAEAFTNSLTYIAKSHEEEFQQTLESSTMWTVALSDKSLMPLRPPFPFANPFATKVQYADRLRYISQAEHARLTESQLQIEALRKGLSEVIPMPLIDFLSPQDLEWKICGRPIVDVNLLKKHTNYSGVSADAPHVSYFWQTLQEFNQQDRRGFLRFVWAQERLPVNDDEFERTKTKMTLKPFLGLSDPNSAFPKADTCFFMLMLPQYTSQKILREKLLFAIYTDSHSMNADEPQEDPLATFNTGGGRARGRTYVNEEEDSGSEEE